MPEDKSLFFYGALFHRFLDPLLIESRRVAISSIEEGSSILDIASGTGVFAIMAREQKHCRVVGIDLSKRMLAYAQKSNPYAEVTFRHQDATDLSDFADGSFDYATILMLVHEITRTQQLAVLQHALRVARKVIIIDSVCPLPRNARGMGIRVVEATIGHDHNRDFVAFLAGGGIGGILKEINLPIQVEQRCVFERDCREMVLVTSKIKP